ncbi:SDR family NAD(P)-dependent oxidoreductase, partial [Mesorhizobium sp. M8A.F.Ca.ET.023.02.2.1]
IARDLVAHGFTVLVGSRNFERGEAAARDIGQDARAFQLEVTDQASIAAAAERIRNELGRLDVLVNNAAISNTSKRPGQSIEDYAKLTRPSNVSLDEVRAVWETNVFGVLAVTQAMLPLLREARAARIVNVSSGVGSLTRNADPAFPYRSIFGPVYPASKTALNAMTLAMAIELEPTGIKVNAVSPGFTKTNLNGYAGTETVEQGAREAVRVAMLGPDGPTGTFTHAELGTIPW